MASLGAKLCDGCRSFVGSFIGPATNEVDVTKDEERRKAEKPQISESEAAEVARALFGVDVQAIKELDSYDDRNFQLTVGIGSEVEYYTLKVHNGVESDKPQELAAQNAMLRRLRDAGISCPVPVMGKDGADTCYTELQLRVPEAENADADAGAGANAEDGDTEGAADAGTPLVNAGATAAEDGAEAGADGGADGAGVTVPGGSTGAASAPSKPFAVRLLTWVGGTIMNTAPWQTQMRAMPLAGRFLGQMQKALEQFDHPGAHRPHQWDLNNTDALRSFVCHVDDAAHQALVHGTISEFEQRVLPSVVARRASGSGAAGGGGLELRWGVLQSDFSCTNIVLSDDMSSVHGVIDFGDAVYSLLVNDVAIAMAYAVVEGARQAQKAGALDGFDSAEVLTICSAFSEGYTSCNALTRDERSVLLLLIACRLSMSVTLGAYSFAQDPTNEYLLLYAKSGWHSLSLVRSLDADAFDSAITPAVD